MLKVKIFIAIVVFGLIALIMTYSGPSQGATGTSVDHRLAEVEQVVSKFHPDAMASEKEGLTALGYELFFPGRDIRSGLNVWRKLGPLQRLSYLERNASPFVRGVWAGGRNRELIEYIKGKSPESTPEEINQVIENLGVQAVQNCLESKTMHVDLCILMLGRIGSYEEINQARQVLAEHTNRLVSRTRGSKQR